MLVVLRENIENLGRIGDVVKVSDGYARNFLLPRHMVVAADAKNIAEIEHQKRMLEKKRLAAKGASEELAKKLNGLTVTLARKVGENDRLFGSVSNGDIAEAVKKAGYSVERRSIQIDAPIKTLGTHEVDVKLDADVTASIKVQINKED